MDGVEEGGGERCVNMGVMFLKAGVAARRWKRLKERGG